MPRRSSVLELPQEVKAELDQKLVASGFSNYAELSAWLGSQGFQISKSSVHRYGSEFEERVRALKLATEQAKAIVAESPDDEGSVNEALTRLLQERLFGVLLDLEIEPEEIDVHKLGRVIADLGRASVTQKKWAREARREALHEAAEVATKVAQQQGVSKEGINAIREALTEAAT